MPLDGPLWRLYLQKEFIDEDGKKKGIIIMKSHHSLADGASLISWNLAMSSDYNRNYLVPIKDAAWY